MAIPNNPIRRRAIQGQGRRRGALSVQPRTELQGTPSFPSGFSYDPEEDAYDLAYGPRDMRRKGGMSEAQRVEEEQRDR